MNSLGCFSVFAVVCAFSFGAYIAQAEIRELRRLQAYQADQIFELLRTQAELEAALRALPDVETRLLNLELCDPRCR